MSKSLSSFFFWEVEKPRISKVVPVRQEHLAGLIYLGNYLSVSSTLLIQTHITLQQYDANQNLIVLWFLCITNSFFSDDKVSQNKDLFILRMVQWVQLAQESFFFCDLFIIHLKSYYQCPSVSSGISVVIVSHIQSTIPINFTPYRIKIFYPKPSIKLLNHSHHLFFLRSALVMIIFSLPCLFTCNFAGKS